MPTGQTRPGVTDDAARRNKRRVCDTERKDLQGALGPETTPCPTDHPRQLQLLRSPVGWNEIVSEECK